MDCCMDVSTLGPCLQISEILSGKCSSVNFSGGDWLMLCQLMEMIVLVVCRCWLCLLLIHFCGQDGEFFGIGCCMNYEILLKEIEVLLLSCLSNKQACSCSVFETRPLLHYGHIHTSVGKARDIRGGVGGGSILRYDAMSLGDQFLMFQRNAGPSSSHRCKVLDL